MSTLREPPPPCRPARSNEHSYMCVRLPGLIQGQGQLARKMVFQPASLQSNLHKQMRAAAEKLHVRKQKVRAAPAPERSVVLPAAGLRPPPALMLSCPRRLLPIAPPPSCAAPGARHHHPCGPFEAQG